MSVCVRNICWHRYKLIGKLFYFILLRICLCVCAFFPLYYIQCCMLYVDCGLYCATIPCIHVQFCLVRYFGICLKTEIDKTSPTATHLKIHLK